MPSKTPRAAAAFPLMSVTIELTAWMSHNGNVLTRQSSSASVTNLAWMAILRATLKMMATNVTTMMMTTAPMKKPTYHPVNAATVIPTMDPQSMDDT